MASESKLRSTSVTAAKLSVDERADEKVADAMHTARVMLNGHCNGMVVQKYLSHINDGGDLVSLTKVSVDQQKQIAGGDLNALEYMLLTQATAMQAMFTNLATRAHAQTQVDALQTMTTLALKCATHSRQAITALAELRTPRTVMFAKQANVTSGPQQVNNGMPAPGLPGSRVHAHEVNPAKQPNELSGTSHALPQDARAAGQTSGANTRLEAMAASHWAVDGSR